MVPGSSGWKPKMHQRQLQGTVAETQEYFQPWCLGNILNFSFPLFLRYRYLQLQVNLQSTWSQGGNMEPGLKKQKQNQNEALAGVAQWIECQPVNQRVVV